MHLLIEMLWTRLGLLTGALPPWGEDLHAERLSPFLFCRPVQDDDGPLRWQLGVHELREDQLEELAARDGRWMPVELTQTEWIAMSRLAGDVVIDVADEGFRRWTESRGVDPEELVQGLVATRLAAREGDRLVPVARRLRTSVLPDGRRVAADDNTGRLGRWIAAEFPNDDLD